MFIGKLAGAAIGWRIDPWVGILLGAMLGHLLDLGLGRWRAHHVATREKRRTRRRSIKQATTRARGATVRTSPVPELRPRVSAALQAHLAVLRSLPEDDRDTVKARWRRLVAEQHPDRRLALGQNVDDDSARTLAAVQNAWKAVKQARGWR